MKIGLYLVFLILLARTFRVKTRVKLSGEQGLCIFTLFICGDESSNIMLNIQTMVNSSKAGSSTVVGGEMEVCVFILSNGQHIP